MIDQFEYRFIGSNGVKSRCNIMIFSDDGEHFICFENIGEGVSVTNASELLATKIVQMKEFNPSDCRFFETYKEYIHDTIDEIEYIWSKTALDETDIWIAKSPRWTPASEEIRTLFLK